MRYLGGKSKVAKHVVQVIDDHRAHGDQIVWEPFCGGLNVTSKLFEQGISVLASDVSEALISLFRAVQGGWDPPSEMSERLWRDALAMPETCPLHGFAAFGMSFGGRKGGGYCHPHVRKYRGRDVIENPARAMRKALLRDVPRAAAIERLDFLAIEPFAFDMLIYCDPPYRGRTGYGVAFDHDLFYRRCVEWWERGVRLLVSEYDFPLGEIVWERERPALLRGKETKHTERIYLV